MAIEGWRVRRSGTVARVRLAARRRELRSQALRGGLFVVAALVIGAGVRYFPDWVPPSTFLLLEVVAVFLLAFPMLVVLGAVILAETALLWAAGVPTVIPGVRIVVALSVAAMLGFAWRRRGVGRRGEPGERMLVDLRDRLAAHGRVPPLPPGWHVESVLMPAHADAFSGDFMVAALRDGPPVLEMVLVDVSGKGRGAGVRSLQLSGAFGGLLGAMPRERFLPAANEYVLAQRWDEGFATAVHVAVDLRTGEYAVASAGHPPALHLHAGSGRLDVVDSVGSPALGVVDDLVCVARAGRLDHGDVLLLYTDGLVDAPGTELDRGIDRLMGVADRVLGPRRGGAVAVLAGVAAADDDDRALVLLRRD